MYKIVGITVDSVFVNSDTSWHQPKVPVRNVLVDYPPKKEGSRISKVIVPGEDTATCSVFRIAVVDELEVLDLELGKDYDVLGQIFGDMARSLEAHSPLKERAPRYEDHLDRVSYIPARIESHGKPTRQDV